MKKPSASHRHLLEQLAQVAEGLGATFAPFCEVVVHDLLDPSKAVVAIRNSLSGREVGDPATELGLSRIADPAYPQVVANYPNEFADGRRAKSTSIGIKDEHGDYVAAVCLNVDLTLFHGLQHAMAHFTRVASDAAPGETLVAAGAVAIRAHIDQFAARCASAPRALKADERRQLLRELNEAGLMQVRRAMETVAQHLGVSRATVYSSAKHNGDT